MFRFLLVFALVLSFSTSILAASQSQVLQAAFQKNVLGKDLGMQNFKYFVHFEKSLKVSHFQVSYLRKAVRSVDLIDFSNERTSSIGYSRPASINLLTIPTFVTFSDRTIHDVAKYDAAGLGNLVQALFYVVEAEDGISNKPGLYEPKQIFKKEISKLYPALAPEYVEELAVETLAQSMQYITNDYFLTFKSIQRRCAAGKAISQEYLAALYKLYHPQYLQIQAFIEVNDKPYEFRTTMDGALNTAFLNAMFAGQLTGEVGHDFKFIFESSACERSRTLQLAD